MPLPNVRVHVSTPSRTAKRTVTGICARAGGNRIRCGDEPGQPRSTALDVGPCRSPLPHRADRASHESRAAARPTQSRAGARREARRAESLAHTGVDRAPRKRAARSPRARGLAVAGRAPSDGTSPSSSLRTIASTAIDGINGPSSPSAIRCQERSVGSPSAVAPGDRDEHSAAMLAPAKRDSSRSGISGASGNSDGTSTDAHEPSEQRSSARCRISGTGPAPIQTLSTSGQSSASTRRSGTSTSENSVLLQRQAAGRRDREARVLRERKAVARRPFVRSVHALAGIACDRANHVHTDARERRRRDAGANRIDALHAVREPPHHGGRQHRKARRSRETEDACRTRLRIEHADAGDELARRRRDRDSGSRAPRCMPRRAR